MRADRSMSEELFFDLVFRRRKSQVRDSSSEVLEDTNRISRVRKYRSPDAKASKNYYSLFAFSLSLVLLCHFSLY
jgi:hypothetical protein